MTPIDEIVNTLVRDLTAAPTMGLPKSRAASIIRPLLEKYGSQKDEERIEQMEKLADEMAKVNEETLRIEKEEYAKQEYERGREDGYHYGKKEWLDEHEETRAQAIRETREADIAAIEKVINNWIKLSKERQIDVEILAAIKSLNERNEEN